MKEPIKRIFAAFITAALLILTAGCAQTASGTGEEKPLIGFSLRFIAGSPWLSTLAQTADDEGTRLGYTMDIQDAAGDPVTQIAQMNQFITKGAKAIIIEPVADQSVAAGILAAEKAGIPVIVVNDRVSDELATIATCNIMDDATKTGELVGAYAAKVADERVPKDEAIKLFVMALFPDELVTETREKAFMAGWDKYFANSKRPAYVKAPNLYGKAQPDLTLQMMRSFLAGNPDVDVIYNESDNVNGAVLQALRDAGLADANGKSKVVVAGFDGAQEVVGEMGNPDYPVVATALNQPNTQAKMAIEEAIAAIDGKETGKCNDTVTPGTDKASYRVLEAHTATKDNYKDYSDPAAEYAHQK